MVRVKSKETRSRNTAKRSLMTFLEGGKYSKDKKPMTLNWITTVIASSGVRGDKLREIFNELRDYGDRERFISVLERCEKENLLK